MKNGRGGRRESTWDDWEGEKGGKVRCGMQSPHLAGTCILIFTSVLNQTSNAGTKPMMKLCCEVGFSSQLKWISTLPNIECWTED